MATDSYKLLLALEDYRACLQRQTATFRAELSSLESTWAQFSSVYEGTAAEQFRQGWLRTNRMLNDYIQVSERLEPLLRERIEALRAADRPDLPLP